MYTGVIWCSYSPKLPAKCRQRRRWRRTWNLYNEVRREWTVEVWGFREVVNMLVLTLEEDCDSWHLRGSACLLADSCTVPWLSFWVMDKGFWKKLCVLKVLKPARKQAVLKKKRWAELLTDRRMYLWLICRYTLWFWIFETCVLYF